METLTFAGTSFATYNTFWDGKNLFIAPEKDVTFYEVPGRNGALSVSNNRFKAKEIPINCFIRSNFAANYSSLIDFLYSQDGYKRLENSKESDIYQMACFVEPIEPNTGAFLKYGDFALTFKVYPQKWLKSGETAITVTTTSQTVANPTKQKALPMFEVTGTGSITVNNSVLTLSANTGTTIIDCETQDCYQGSTNRNGDLTIVGGFPVLGASNTVVMTGFTTCKMYPRWWKL